MNKYYLKSERNAQIYRFLNLRSNKIHCVVIHVKQLSKPIVIEYSSPHKDLAGILSCYHKEKCWILLAIKTSSFLPPNIHVVEKIEIITAIVTHTCKLWILLL